MIGYTMLGTNDHARAKAFYDPLMDLLGAKANAGWSSDARTFYMAAAGAPMLVLTKPYDDAPATAGNGTMVALTAPTREVIDELYAKAMATGATDEGAPGLRGDAFYGAYFRDPDGNKICVFKFG